MDYRLADQEVELTARGSWDLGLEGGLGGGWDPFGWRPGWLPQGLKGGFGLAQSADVEFSLLIDRRWLARLRYVSGEPTNAFLLGYRGQEGESLRFAHVGLYPLTITPAAGLAPLPNRSGTPAANLGLGWDGGWLEALAQYESRTGERLQFRGRRALLRTTLSVRDWIRGRYFRLPGSAWPNLRFLALSGGLSRDPLPGEIRFEASRGVVEIPRLLAETYLVTWTGMSPGVDPITGQPLPTLTVGSDTYLVLYRGMAYSPLELKNRYRLPAQASEVTILVSRRAQPLDPQPPLRITTDREREILIVEGTAAVGPDYPFFELVEGLYGPGEEDRTGTLELSLTILGPEGPLALGTGVQEGSIRVWRNGREFSRFRFDARSGNLEILDPISFDDEWEVFFLRQSPESGPPRLFFYQTFSQALSPSAEIQAALGLSWPMDGSTFTEREGQAPGDALGRVLTRQRGEGWLWETSLEGRLSVPDATGRRVWDSLGRQPGRLALDGDMVRPGSLPPQEAAWGVHNPGQLVSLTFLNRGRLRYRAAYERDLFGNLTLKSWDTPGLTTEPYEAAGKTGPYLALASPTDAQRSLVLEYELSPLRRWVSAQVFLHRESEVDLGGLRRLRLRHRLVSSDPPPVVYLLVGSLGEDPDGTAQVRPAVSGLIPGLPWTDQAEGLELIFPTPDSRPSSTGRGGKTWYQEAVAERVVSRQLPPPGPTWSSVEIDFSPDEASRLVRANSLQLVLVSATPASLSGVYQVTALEWEGSRAHARALPPNTQAPQVWEGTDTLRVEAPAGPWEARLVLSSRLDPGAYRRLRFRLRLASGPNPTPLTLRWEDATGQGLVWQVNLIPSPAWREVELNIDGLSASLDGQPAGSLSRAASGAWSDLVLQSSSPLSLELDQLEALDAVARVSTTARTLGRWERGGLALEGEVESNLQDELGLRAETTFQWGPWRSWTLSRLVLEHDAWRFSWAYRESLDWAWGGLMDAFDDRGSRRQSAFLRLGPLGRVGGEALLEWSPWTLLQDWRLSWRETSHDWPLTPSWEAGLSQRSAAGLEGRSWELWRKSLVALYDPAPPLTTQRHGWLRSRLETQGQGAWLELEGGGRSWSTQEGTLQTHLAANTGLTWRSGGHEALPVSLQVQASRRWEGRRTGLGFPSLAGSAQLWAHQAAQGVDLLLLPPMREWFIDAAELWSGRDPATVEILEGQVRLGTHRAPLLGRLDFLLPSALDLSHTIRHLREGAVQPPHQQSWIQLQWQSLNQFGSLSAEPLLGWYEQDEWATTLRWERREDPPREITWRWTLLQRLELHWESARVQLRHLLDLPQPGAWAWSGGITARWDVPVDLPWHIPYLRTPYGFQERLEVSLSAESQWGGRTLGPPLQRASVQPAASWTFHPNGTLTGKLTAAVDVQEGAGAVGIDFSIMVRLRF